MTVITLTPTPLGSPSPFVDVLVSSISAGVNTVTVYRTAKGRTFPVRGLVDVLATGGVSIRDYEAPFLVESSYQVEQFDVSGVSLGFVGPVVTTLTGLPYERAWFHDPLDPTTSVMVRFLAGAAREIGRSSSSDSISIPGRSVGLVMPGTRGGVKGVVLDCLTETQADGEAFDAMFGDYDSEDLSIVCVRSRPETWLPATLFAFVGDPKLRPLDNAGQVVGWGVTGDETVPPTPAVITPLLTYDDFTAFYATYTAFTAAYPDYITASRDYSLISS